MLWTISLTVPWLWVPPAHAAHLEPLPEGAAPANCVVLEMEPAGPDASPLAGGPVEVHPRSTQVEPGLVTASGGGTLRVRHDKYGSSKVVINYDLTRSLPGIYEVYTAFALGGVAEQHWSLSAGGATGPLVPRGDWKQSNEVSWQMRWRKAPHRLALYPHETRLQIMEEGNASGQKLLDAVLLVRAGELPAEMTGDGGRLRAQVQTWNPAEPLLRAYLLESGRATESDVFYRALAGRAAELQARCQVQIEDGPDEVLLARDLAISRLPALVLMDGRYAVHTVLSGQVNAARASAAVAAWSEGQATVAPGPASDPSVHAPQTMRQGVPASWLVAGTWAGPGGLSLWGPGAEAAIRPSLGDPCIVEHFDSVVHSSWLNRFPLPDGQVVVESPTQNWTWSKGTAYAALYLNAKQRVGGLLHLSQTGFAQEAWLDGAPLAGAKDNRPPAMLPALPGAQIDGAREVGETDQGNRIAVEAIARAAPQVMPFQLTPGWHRLLLKLVMRHATGETFAFTARFTDEAGNPLSRLTSQVHDPDVVPSLHQVANRLALLLSTDAPFNLNAALKPVRLRFDLRRLATKKEPDPIVPLQPFRGRLVARVFNYDGGLVEQREVTGLFPGTVTMDLGQPLAAGYYVVQTALYATDGRPITVFPPDGFSVLGGTAAMTERAGSKKMAATYYFMAGGGKYKTLYFPYMHRLGLLRAVGGNNGRALAFYRQASEEGLRLAADLWGYTDPTYVKDYVAETLPYVDTFKSYNEIDIVPAMHGTPEHWLSIAKLHYDTVKSLDPGKRVLGGSLARPGVGDWFRDCLRLGLDGTVDAWDVHCYPQTPPVLEGSMANSPNETELGVLKAYRELGRENTKPFWIGETGARASHGADARRWQADTVAKMTACANSRRDFEVISFLIPWEYSRQNDSQGDIEVGHMPAEAAYYTASALIDGFPYRRLAPDGEVQVARFGPTTMLWSVGHPCRYELQLEAGKTWVKVDVVGRVTRLNVDPRGSATLLLTDSPIYILEAGEYQRLTRF